MDSIWLDWLSAQHHEYGMDADRVLRYGIFFNALHNSGIDHTPNLEPHATVTQWSGMDSEDAYNRHLASPIKRGLLASNGWVDTPIQYELNSWGFRSKGCVEFDSIAEPSLITMGCSFTFGTGLPGDSIWPELTAQHMGLGLINLATPGHGLSMGTQWLLTQGSSLVNPRAIAILMPPPGRITWYERNPAGQIVGNTFSMIGHQRNVDLMQGLAINAHMDYIKNYHAICLWANSRNIPVSVIVHPAIHPNSHGLARDLAHKGAPWHSQLSLVAVETLKALDKL